MFNPAERRELLFALVALRNNLISEGDLLKAIATWSESGTGRLGEILSKQGLVTQEQVEFLNELTANCTVRKSKSRMWQQALQYSDKPMVVAALA